MNKANNKKIQSKKPKIKLGFKYSLILSTIFTIFSVVTFMNSVYAESINSANIYKVGNCGNLLTYNGVNVEVSYVEYNHSGISYPAYCLDKTKPGVETVPYEVSVQ